MVEKNYVYRYVHPKLGIIYVGRTNNLTKRISQHDKDKNDNIPRKYTVLLDECVIESITLANKAQAIATEAYFIDKEKPMLNKSLNYQPTKDEIDDCKGLYLETPAWKEFRKPRRDKSLLIDIINKSNINSYKFPFDFLENVYQLFTLDDDLFFYSVLNGDQGKEKIAYLYYNDTEDKFFLHVEVTNGDSTLDAVYQDDENEFSMFVSMFDKFIPSKDIYLTLFASVVEFYNYRRDDKDICEFYEELISIYGKTYQKEIIMPALLQNDAYKLEPERMNEYLKRKDIRLLWWVWPVGCEMHPHFLVGYPFNQALLEACA